MRIIHNLTNLMTLLMKSSYYKWWHLEKKKQNNLILLKLIEFLVAQKRTISKLPP